MLQPTKTLAPIGVGGFSLCQLAAVSNHHRLGSLARLGAHGLNLLHDIHALSHGAKDHMLTIQPLSLHSAQEELRAIGVRTSVGHGQNAGAGVLQGEVLICKLGTIDGFATSAVARSEVAALSGADPCQKKTTK